MDDMEAHMAKRTELDAREKEIESNINTYAPMTGARRRVVDTILEATRKTKNINIRINELDLANLRKNADEEGIPYQTLISSVLHKYLAGRLVDEKHVRKSIEMLSRKKRAR
jgi:predicted DNA binding CopG/RHH family protein